uniref:Cytochrome P450 n=1 Tax=Leersia perrieri TaxID=77586 RepID=A0A0D9XI53_9ORYZ
MAAFFQLCAASLPLVVLTSYAIQPLADARRRLPPGPRPLPLIGNLLDVGENPHRAFARLAETHGAPLMSIRLGAVYAVVASTPETAREILQRQNAAMSSRRSLDAWRVMDHPSNSMIALPPRGKWRAMRQHTAAAMLGPRRLAEQRAAREEQELVLGGSSIPTAVEWAMAELLQNPKTMKKLQEELRTVLANKPHMEESDITQLPYLQAVVKETLRLHPPLPFSAGLADESVEINGYNIPEGTASFVNIWAICRNAEIWNKPDKFMPERFLQNKIDFSGTNFEFIPFSTGRRICPGLNLSSKLVPLMLGSLLHQFDWTLPEDVGGNGCTAETWAAGGEACKDDLLDVFLDMEGEVRGRVGDEPEETIRGNYFNPNCSRWAMAELLQNPKTMKKLQEELRTVLAVHEKIHNKPHMEESDITQLPYLQAVVKETLRLHPPLPFAAGLAEESVEINGYSIPEGTAAFNAEIRNKPDKFLPKSTGRRICPGLNLSSKLVPLMLGSLHHQFDWTLPEVVGGNGIDMSEKFGLVLSMAVPLTAVPKKVL